MTFGDTFNGCNVVDIRVDMPRCKKAKFIVKGFGFRVMGVRAYQD